MQSIQQRCTETRLGSSPHELSAARQGAHSLEESSAIVPLADAKDSGERKSQTRYQNDHRRARPMATEWLGYGVVVVVYALGAWLSWRKWPDLLVDFGEQLYLPWRISEGSVLYRDVMYLTGGPLSQYYHAALFKVFGV
jgi:hypothetical protein